jgi:hypothetical protein
MSIWLKALIGIAIAIPVGILAFIWWLEAAFTSGGCKQAGLGEGPLSNQASYRIVRLRCSGLPDEITVAVGPADDRWAAIVTKGGPAPKLKRMDGDRTVLFEAGSTELRVELDAEGYPRARIDLKDGKVVDTVPHKRR